MTYPKAQSGFGSLLPQDDQAIHVSIDPITLMINECMILLSLMRKSSRWSQSGVAAILGSGDIFGGDIFGGDDIPQGLAVNTSSKTNDNPLFSSFLQLRSILTDGKSVEEIDSLTLLQPFLLAIKSSSTSGHITSLALNSVYKLLQYGIISSSSLNIQTTVIQITLSLTHCRFEAADQNSDDAVLLKVLRLLESIVNSHLSELLPNEVISEIVQTCLSLACNKKRSEVLRKSAEIAMVSITYKVFGRLREIEPEKVELPVGNIDFQTRDSLEIENSETKLRENSVEPLQEKPKEVELTPVIAPEISKDSSDSYGIVAIHEFLIILISIIAPENQFQHMESTRVFALNLIDTAIEVAGVYFPLHPSLFTLISDLVSKHVLQILTTTESTVLLQASLKVFLTLAIVLGRYLKSQLELSLNLIFQSILPGADTPEQIARPAAPKEMLIESLSLLWTRSPVFFTNLFIDYDCDFDKSDLAQQSLRFLCQLALPEAASTTTEAVPPICLESILSFIGGINDRIKNVGQLEGEPEVTETISNKEKKTLFIQCSHVLNQKPKEGIKMLAEHGFITDPTNIPELAEFFFTKSARLNKKVLGEVLSKPTNVDLLTEFINRFDFTDVRVDEALRILLKTFRLPGESQMIQRIVETFADRYVACQSEVPEVSKIPGTPEGTSEGSESVAVTEDTEKAISVDPPKSQTPETPKIENETPSETTNVPVRPDADSVFILSYSIILLNTDLYNPQVKKHMLLDDYKRNLRGMYNGKDYPEWYMAKIYSSIKDREIIMPEEHHGTDKWYDDAWNNLISLEVHVDITPKEYSQVAICQFDKVLFESVVDEVIDTLIAVFKEALDDHIITRLMSLIDKCANICIYYGLASSIDKLILSLSGLSSLVRDSKRVIQGDENLREEIPITQIKNKLKTKNKLESLRETKDKEVDDITVSETAVWFGRDFKAQLLTVVLFRLIKKSDCKVSGSYSKVIQIILTLFENCLINPNLFGEFQKKINLSPLPRVKPRYIINRSKPNNNSGILSTFSLFLKGYSDDPPEPSDQEIESTLSTIDCVKSINIPGIFEVISRGPTTDLKLFVELLLGELPTFSEENKRYFETESLFILEICVCFCLLVNDIDLICEVYKKLTIEVTKKGQLRLVTFKLLLLRYIKDDVSNLLIQISTLDKELLIKNGNQILQPLLYLIDEKSENRGILAHDEFWKILRIFGSIPEFADKLITFIEDIPKEEIVPENYMPLLGLLDEISSLGAIASLYEQHQHAEKSELNEETYSILVAHSKKSITLTADLQGISGSFKERDLSYLLIQALAHQCFNPCREVRAFALATLQSTVLSHNNEITAFGIFEYGLFPLLTELNKPEVLSTDREGFNRTQIEAVSLISKVFLKYCGDFGQDLPKVWIGILDNVVGLSERGSDKFKESVVEALKNMILVLQEVPAYGLSDEVWDETWRKIGGVYPSLKPETAEARTTEAIPHTIEAIPQGVVEAIPQGVVEAIPQGVVEAIPAKAEVAEIAATIEEKAEVTIDANIPQREVNIPQGSSS